MPRIESSLSALANSTNSSQAAGNSGDTQFNSALQSAQRSAAPAGQNAPAPAAAPSAPAANPAPQGAAVDGGKVEPAVKGKKLPAKAVVGKGVTQTDVEKAADGEEESQTAEQGATEEAGSSAEAESAEASAAAGSQRRGQVDKAGGGQLVIGRQTPVKAAVQLAAPVDSTGETSTGQTSTANHADHPEQATSGDSAQQNPPPDPNAVAAVTVVPPPRQDLAGNSSVGSDGSDGAGDSAPPALAAVSRGKTAVSESNTPGVSATPGGQGAAAVTTEAAANVTNSTPSTFAPLLQAGTAAPPVVVVQSVPATANTRISLAAVTASLAPEASFAAANHPAIVTGVHGQLLPDGGTMQIRLSPPELGDMQINIQVSNGAVSAAFQTSTDEATRSLTHSLGQLKTGLEAAGMTVEKLQVSQTSRDNSQQKDSSWGEEKQNFGGNEQTQRDQQRREMLRRMWKKVAGGDDLDMVA